MTPQEYEIYQIKNLSERRGKAAKKKALLTPKGHSTDFISEAHTPSYMDAIRDLNSLRRQLKRLLRARIRDDRTAGMSWKAIREKYQISQSTLNDFRRMYKEIQQ